MKIEPLTRRKLLRRAMAGIIALPLGYAAYRLIGPVQTRNWNFLSRQLPSNEDLRALTLTDFIALSPEIRVATEEESRLLTDQNSRNGIERRLLNEGLAINPNETRASVIRQFYGYPEEATIAQGVIEYAQEGVTLIYEEIPGLNEVDLRWTPIQNGQNFSSDYHQRIFVGRFLTDLERFNAHSIRDPDKKVLITEPLGRWNAGGVGFSTIDAPGQKKWGIFLSSYYSALWTIFSELTPIFLDSASTEFIKKEGQIAGRQAIETISEGLSYVFAKKLIRRLGIPNGLQYLENKRELEQRLEHNTLHQYDYVPDSIRWIEAHGVQRAFDLYMEDPKKFMQEVQKK